MNRGTTRVAVGGRRVLLGSLGKDCNAVRDAWLSRYGRDFARTECARGFKGKRGCDKSFPAWCATWGYPWGAAGSSGGGDPSTQCPLGQMANPNPPPACINVTQVDTPPAGGNWFGGGGPGTGLQPPGPILPPPPAPPAPLPDDPAPLPDDPAPLPDSPPSQCTTDWIAERAKVDAVLSRIRRCGNPDEPLPSEVPACVSGSGTGSRQEYLAARAGYQSARDDAWALCTRSDPTDQSRPGGGSTWFYPVNPKQQATDVAEDEIPLVSPDPPMRGRTKAAVGIGGAVVVGLIVFAIIRSRRSKRRA